MKKTRLLHFINKLICLVVISAFSVNTILVQSSFAQIQPGNSNIIGPSPSFAPPILMGVKVYPQEPFKFNFILSQGDGPSGNMQNVSKKLIKYFLAALTTPDDEMWVNLSPYEKNRIVPKKFVMTEMGRDMLAQDYLLKKLTASLMYPEKDLGKEFWTKVYDEAYKKYGITDIPMDTFNKVWIVPEKAVVYDNGDSAFVVESRLKVMMERDYLAQREAGNVPEAGPVNGYSAITSSMIKQIIIPAIEREVNEGEHFSALRQIYNSMILATWFKRNLKQSLLSQIYVGKNKVKGVDTKDKDAKRKIYDRYLESFKKGVYNYIKEDYDPKTQSIVPRKYFSGGINFGKDLAMVYDQSGNKTIFSRLTKYGGKLFNVGINLIKDIKKGLREKTIDDIQNNIGVSAYISTDLFRNVTLDLSEENILVRNLNHSILYEKRNTKKIFYEIAESYEANKYLINSARKLSELKKAGVKENIPDIIAWGVNKDGRFWIEYEWIKSPVILSPTIVARYSPDIKLHSFIKLAKFLRLIHSKGFELGSLKFNVIGFNGNNAGIYNFAYAHKSNIADKMDVYKLGLMLKQELKGEFRELGLDDLIDEMLKNNPRERPGIKDVVARMERIEEKYFEVIPDITTDSKNDGGKKDKAMMIGGQKNISNNLKDGFIDSTKLSFVPIIKGALKKADIPIENVELDEKSFKDLRVYTKKDARFAMINAFGIVYELIKNAYGENKKEKFSIKLLKDKKKGYYKFEIENKGVIGQAVFKQLKKKLRAYAKEGKLWFDLDRKRILIFDINAFDGEDIRPAEEISEGELDDYISNAVESERGPAELFFVEGLGRDRAAGEKGGDGLGLSGADDFSRDMFGSKIFIKSNYENGTTTAGFKFKAEESNDNAMNSFVESKVKIFNALKGYPVLTRVKLKNGNLLVGRLQYDELNRPFFKIKYGRNIFKVDARTGKVSMSKMLNWKDYGQILVSGYRMEGENIINLYIDGEKVQVLADDPMNIKLKKGRHTIFIHPDFDPEGDDVFNLDIESDDARESLRSVIKGEFSEDSAGLKLSLNSVKLDQQIEGNDFSGFHGLNLFSEIMRIVKEAAHSSTSLFIKKVDNEELQLEIRDKWEELKTTSPWKEKFKGFYPQYHGDNIVEIQLDEIENLLNEGEYKKFREIMNKVMLGTPYGKALINAGFKNVTLDFDSMISFGEYFIITAESDPLKDVVIDGNKIVGDESREHKVNSAMLVSGDQKSTVGQFKTRSRQAGGAKAASIVSPAHSVPPDIVMPKLINYKFDYPFKVFSGKDVKGDTRKDTLGRLKYLFFNKIRGESELKMYVDRVEELADYNENILNYFKEKYPEYEVINISVFGGFIQRKDFSDIDFDVIIRGNEMKYISIKDDEVTKITNGSKIAGKVISQIDFNVIGLDNLESGIISNETKKNYLKQVNKGSSHSPEDKMRSNLYIRNFVVYGDSFERPKYIKWNQLVSTFGSLENAYKRMEDLYIRQESASVRYKVALKRILLAALRMSFIEPEKEIDLTPIKILISEINGEITDEQKVKVVGFYNEVKGLYEKTREKLDKAMIGINKAQEIDRVQFILDGFIRKSKLTIEKMNNEIDSFLAEHFVAGNGQQRELLENLEKNLIKHLFVLGLRKERLEDNAAIKGNPYILERLDTYYQVYDVNFLVEALDKVIAAPSPVDIDKVVEYLESVRDALTEIYQDMDFVGRLSLSGQLYGKHLRLAVDNTNSAVYKINFKDIVDSIKNTFSRRRNYPAEKLQRLFMMENGFSNEYNIFLNKDDYDFEDNLGYIIQELLANALDENKGGPINVRITKIEGKSKYRFEIENQGTILPKVFVELRKKLRALAADDDLYFDVAQQRIVISSKVEFDIKSGNFIQVNEENFDLYIDKFVKAYGGDETALFFIEGFGRDKVDGKDLGGGGTGLYDAFVCVKEYFGEMLDIKSDEQKGTTTVSFVFPAQMVNDKAVGEKVSGHLSVVSAPGQDSAMGTKNRIDSVRDARGIDPILENKYGGIDFNPNYLNLEIKRDGKGVPLSVQFQPKDIIEIDGLVPVIIQITPIINLPMFLGLNTDSHGPGNTDKQGLKISMR